LFFNTLLVKFFSIDETDRVDSLNRFEGITVEGSLQLTAGIFNPAAFGATVQTGSSAAAR